MPRAALAPANPDPCRRLRRRPALQPALFAHPMLVGGLAALIPGMPRPEWAHGTVPAVAWFAFVGLSNGQVHMLVDGISTQARKALDLFVPWVRQKLGLPPSPSTVPPAPPPPASDPMPSSDGVELEHDDR